MSTPLTADFGPCEDWPVYYPCDVAGVDSALLARALRFATEVVWALSGRQFGLCTVTLRPCRRDCSDVSPYGWSWSEWPAGLTYPTPALIGGAWFNLVCGGCGDNCSCNRVSEVDLPAPVHDVVQVKVDGTPLVTGAYRLDDNRHLVRIDGGEWPRCNDLNRSDAQIGTWSVTARFGQDVPEGGAWAVGELTCQYVAGATGADCRLPQSVTQLVRQGVTIQFDIVSELLKEGLTGLYFVDSFITTWNPSHLRRRSRTYSVDVPDPRRAGS